MKETTAIMQEKLHEVQGPIHRQSRKTIQTTPAEYTFYEL